MKFTSVFAFCKQAFDKFRANKRSSIEFYTFMISWNWHTHTRLCHIVFAIAIEHRLQRTNTSSIQFLRTHTHTLSFYRYFFSTLYAIYSCTFKYDGSHQEFWRFHLIFAFYVLLFGTFQNKNSNNLHLATIISKSRSIEKPFFNF